MWGRGTVLGDRYTLTERIGGGGMGEVWRADDRVLRRQVAVKVLLPALLDAPGFAARFRREATVLASLSHPGIVDVHDYGESPLETGERVAYIVMGLIEGRTLGELRSRSGPLPPEQALDIAAQALDALHAAHVGGVTHRDIKPSNLMVSEDGRVTVTDFGIARSSAATTSITDSHAVLGTALYMAPEQAEGHGAVAASDLYSMGVVCFELLTGEPPFTGDSVIEIALKHVREPAPDLPGEFPGPVRAFVARALAKKPEERYADASVMAAAARRAAAGRPLGELDAPAGPVVAAAAPAGGEQKKWWQKLRVPAGVVVPVAVSVTVTATVAVTVLQVAPWARDSEARGAGAQPAASASAPTPGGTASGTAAPGGTQSPPPASAVPPPAQDQAAGQGGGGTGTPPGGPGGAGAAQPPAPAPAQNAAGGSPSGGTPAGGGTPSGGSPSGGAGGGSGPTPPQGCGGGVWGAITSVGDGLKVGLASNSQASGTQVVMGGTTAFGWVYERGSYESFRVCSSSGQPLARALTHFGETVRVELGGAGGGLWWNLERVPSSNAYTIKDIAFQGGCLTSNGAGRQLTVTPCTANNRSQQWRIP
ncbi:MULTISPECIES: serine/threonine-protein kinase [Streptomyces]|uniref:serine/threonine-protein kinase n=1 Tax=Streptomyces TaxID=1883 RepID=UPI00167B42F8|nr:MULTISPECIES: serine/threonine-protein kinase [Streptomyces]MBD3575724.1 serine/threonine protein kinase [Streptomyces sp. KD18]GGT25576.1 hypothetical protein GCM10010286_58730 [Streptomyces toxytricini]